MPFGVSSLHGERPQTEVPTEVSRTKARITVSPEPGGFARLNGASPFRIRLRQAVVLDSPANVANSANAGIEATIVASQST